MAKVGVINISDPLNDFPKLLSKDLGTYPREPHTIKVKPDVVPVAMRLHPIPLPRRETAMEDIKNMDKLGVLEETLTPEWAHPMVTIPKPNGGVRVTTDLMRLNPHVFSERFPLLRINDIVFFELNGTKVFSKLELQKA